MTASRACDLLPWHEGVWSGVAKLIESGRLPHAIVLYGPAGIGKRRLADRIARTVLCHEPRPSGPCGTCRSCGFVDAGSHPDFRRVEPAEGGAGIPIGAVRDLIGQFTLAAERAQVAIISPAEAMNQAAANAFLKTLEEPAGWVVFILVSDAPGRLPATIRSRCRKVALPAPSPSEALAWLEPRTKPGNAARLLALAGGAPLTALALADIDDEAELASLHSDTAGLLEGSADPLEVAERWRKTGNGPLVFSALYAALGAAARRGATNPDRLYGALDEVVETRRRWQDVPGLGEQLLYEGMAFRCAGVAAG